MNFYYACCAHGSVFAAAAVLGANTPLFGAIDAFGCPSKGHLLERPVTGRLIRLACGQPYAKRCRAEPTDMCTGGRSIPGSQRPVTGGSNLRSR